jgi:hypothetical protein
MVVGSEVIQNRCNHLAWATPLSPVIHQYRAGSLQDIGVEARVADVFDQVVTHEISPRS